VLSGSVLCWVLGDIPPINPAVPMAESVLNSDKYVLGFIPTSYFSTGEKHYPQATRCEIEINLDVASVLLKPLGPAVGVDVAVSMDRFFAWIRDRFFKRNAFLATSTASHYPGLSVRLTAGFSNSLLRSRLLMKTPRTE
jgi:hypothetical protein